MMKSQTNRRASSPAIALDDTQRALADSATGFADRYAPIATTRRCIDAPEAGAPEGNAYRVRLWEALLEQGFLHMHLPPHYGGDASGLDAVAVVVERFGRALVPGPYVPTVIAGLIAATATGGADAVLRRLADGAAAAVVTGDGLVATPCSDGWRVTGTSAPVLGLPESECILARAEIAGGEGEHLWFHCDAEGPTSGSTARVRPADSVDPTRTAGPLELNDLYIHPEHVLSGIVDEQADLIVAALYAAETAGLTTWLLDTALEHITSRRQFGRVIGSFQAVQHKAAHMLVRSELATTAAWDAARAEHDAPGQQRLLAAHVGLTAMPAAVDQALDCISLLGAIGFTWEHDAHLYWRRALSTTGVTGPEESCALRLGTAALTTQRDLRVVAAHAHPELRATVGAVLDSVLQLPDDPPKTGWAPARGGPRREQLADARLVAPHYPAPYGLAASPEDQAVIVEEFARRDLSLPEIGIADWVLPSLIRYGTDDQQERFIQPTLRGQIVWCQLFSEPGTGSDLAGLSTRARRTTGGWLVTGQKVWNTQAQDADWGVCLARTDADAPKHQGLTYFLVDMRAAGVQVKPLRQATGAWEFNEVFLDDVFVPDGDVVADPGDGWRLALATLTAERSKMGEVAFGHGSTALLRRMIDTESYAGTRTDALQTLGRNAAREQSIGAMALRNTLRRGADPNARAGTESVLKLYNALAQRDNSRATLRLLGPQSSVHNAACDAIEDYLGVPAVLIGGGTVEIQLNLIAQRLLGLPK